MDPGGDLPVNPQKVRAGTRLRFIHSNEISVIIESVCGASDTGAETQSILRRSANEQLDRLIHPFTKAPGEPTSYTSLLTLAASGSEFSRANITYIM